MAHAQRLFRYGEPETLLWEAMAVPEPEPGQVLLRQTAIGVNYIDIYHRTGLYPLPALPAVPGVEGAGVVEAVGAGVSLFQPGDRVAYAGPIGGYATHRLIAADRLVPLPDWVSDAEAAALMLQGMTAQYLLRQTWPVQPGDTVLIHAAAGGVGLLVCSWARALGATVIGTVSTPAKAELARQHGCTHPIVYTEEDFVARVRDITNGQGVPVVYDSVGQSTFAGSLDCLRPRGMLVLFGQASGPVPPFDLGLLASKGSLFITRPTLFTYIASRQELLDTAADLLDALQQGHIRATIGQTFPLQDAAAAHRALESRTTHGATLLLP